MKKRFEETFDSSDTMSTMSHSAMKDVQDPSEDMDYTALWETMMGGDNLKTNNPKTTDVVNKSKKIDQ